MDLTIVFQTLFLVAVAQISQARDCVCPVKGEINVFVTPYVSTEENILTTAGTCLIALAFYEDWYSVLANGKEGFVRGNDITVDRNCQSGIMERKERFIFGGMMNMFGTMAGGAEMMMCGMCGSCNCGDMCMNTMCMPCKPFKCPENGKDNNKPTDHCASTPCQHDGRCVNVYQSFVCYCKNDFTNGIVYSGHNCEIAQTYNGYPSMHHEESTTVGQTTPPRMSSTLHHITGHPTLRYEESTTAGPSPTMHHDESTTAGPIPTLHYEESSTVTPTTSPLEVSTLPHASTTKTNACSSSPCLNGGLCALRDQSYECYCKASAVGTSIYIGRRCELEIHLTPKPETTTWMYIPGK